MFDSAKQNFEMHHTYEDGVFELVDADVHKAFGHTGGDAWYKALGAAMMPATAGRMRGENTHTGSYFHTVMEDGVSFFNPIEDAKFAGEMVSKIPGFENAVNSSTQAVEGAASRAVNARDSKGWSLGDLFSLDGMRAFSGR